MPPLFWTQKQDIGPAKRISHGMAYDLARQRVVLFGGDHGGSPLADTWQWDGSLWTQVGDTGPSARHSLAMTCDAVRQRVILFGGASGANFFGDTWAWDGTEWTQVADTGPSSRASHGMVFDPARGRIVLFGGRGGPGLLRDTWEWTGTEWTQVQDVGPSARAGHAMALDRSLANSPRVLLFGGASADGSGLNDTWAWAQGAWTQVGDTGPQPRVASAAAVDGAVILFGGVNSIDPGLPPADRIIYGDTWRWEGNAWTQVQNMGPAGRWGHGMAFRSEARRVALFGGSTVFAPAEDPSLAPGLTIGTWEAEVGARLGDRGAEGIQIAAVTVAPGAVANQGDTLTITVTLAAPAPSVVTLIPQVYMAQGTDNWEILDRGFDLPAEITIASGESSISFQMVRNGEPLDAGEYVIAIATEDGGAISGAPFTVS